MAVALAPSPRRTSFGANLSRGYLCNANFSDADLSNADLSDAHDLTLEQLGQACGKPKALPPALTLDKPCPAPNARQRQSAAEPRAVSCLSSSDRTPLDTCKDIAQSAECLTFHTPAAHTPAAVSSSSAFQAGSSNTLAGQGKP
jgi:hypothetical protein